MTEPAIIVHGGAGKLNLEKKEAAQRGILNAVQDGWKTLNANENNTALEAVENAVKVLEDDPNFNAGIGSVLALDGKVYMDASIMNGIDLSAGAVCGIQNVRYPISLAKRIRAETNHVLICGEMGEKLAELFGLELANESLITTERRKQWKDGLKKHLDTKNLKDVYLPKNKELISRFPQLNPTGGGTVGAVARDTHGNIAVATSTGGMFLKIPGRVGDTAVIGAGTYAWNQAGGVSATGYGEAGIELAISKSVVDFMFQGKNAQKAVEMGISLIEKYKSSTPFGLIAIDSKAGLGLAHCSEVLVFAARGGPSLSSYKVGLTQDEWTNKH
ncbi:MAG: isoaspartyl peptidase/L-asparaginase family protein [Candidatus Ranarchaeia archaeon]|jgi:beta-aspartyl-peptidase (threonine type)